MKKIIYLLLLVFSTIMFAQVGIGTETPANSAILDISSTNKGILFPRMSTAQRNAIATPDIGLYIFDTNTKSPWFYNGTSWINTAGANYGDIKSGIQSGDHNGWIKLDGRLKSTLTASQQTIAISLSIGTNLPNATNSYLSQNGGTLGAVSAGNNTVNLTAANLPSHNHSFTGTGAWTHSNTHSHTYNDAYFAENRSESDKVGNNSRFGTSANTDNDNSFIWRTNDNTNSVSMSNINTSSSTHDHYFQPSGTIGNTGDGTAINIAPKTLTVNMFIYLGL
jgi:hypothetical protein